MGNFVFITSGLIFIIFTALENCLNALLGPVCLDCKAINKPEDCNIVTKCGQHEHTKILVSFINMSALGKKIFEKTSDLRIVALTMCFLEKYVTNDGIILHNIGCKDIALCNLASSNGFGKRDTKHLSQHKRDVTVVCSECCNSKNICNQVGCRLPPVKLPTGSKLCYKCLSSTHPDTCTQLALCNKDQYCSVSEQRNLLGQLRWKHDCVNKQLCFNSSSPCSHCCNSEVCNDRCTSIGTTQIPVAGISKTTTTTQIPIAGISKTAITTTSSTTQVTTQKLTTRLTTVPSTTVNPTTSTKLQTTTIHKATSTNASPLLVPIIIQLNRRPDRIHLGDTVVITCSAMGNPTPSYNFKFQDGPLPKNGLVKNNTLTLLNFLSQNIGNYECIASNSEGTGNYGFILQST